jgi:hypothetical protein
LHYYSLEIGAKYAFQMFSSELSSSHGWLAFLQLVERDRCKCQFHHEWRCDGMIINHLHGKSRASRSSLHHLTSHKQLTPETMAPRARLFLLVAALAYCSTSQAKNGKDDIVSHCKFR